MIHSLGCPKCGRKTVEDISTKKEDGRPTYKCVKCGHKWMLDRKYKIYEHGGKPCTDCGKLYHWPSERTIRAFIRSDEDEKLGRTSPIFNNVKDMIKYLDDDHAKLLNGDCCCDNKDCKIEETWNKLV